MVSTRGQSSLTSTRDTTTTKTIGTAKGTTSRKEGCGGGAESRPAARKTATAPAKNKGIEVAPSSSPPSSPPRRQRGAAVSTALEEQDRSPKTTTMEKASPHSSLRKQSKKQRHPKSLAMHLSAASTSPSKSAADANSVDSSDDDDEDGDDSLACLAQGMLDALCGLPGGRKSPQGSSDEENDGDEDDDVSDDDGLLLRPTTPTTDNGARTASSESDDSDSDSEDDDDPSTKSIRSRSKAKAAVTWAPRSLLLPAPVTSTRAVELLALESLSSATPERVAERKARLKAKSTESREWFDLPSQAMTPELKTDLRLLRLRGALDPTRHYKSADSTKLPGRFHVGTIVEASTEFYSSRLGKSERGQSLAEELLRDKALSAQRKRRFGALQEAAAARGRKGGGGGRGAKVRKTTMPRMKKHRVRPKH